MFEMLNDVKPDQEARKLFWKKVGYFVVAIGAVSGMIYFFATSSYFH